MRLIPREERFFDLFVEDAANVLGAARLLEAMLKNYDTVERRAGELRDAEHRGDEISRLDDVIDLVEEVGDTFVLYRIDAPTPTAIQQAAIIVRQCEQIHEALGHLRKFQGLDKYWIEIHRLENEGDTVVRGAIAGLFQNGGDPLQIIKWKDIYALLESTIDKCEDVANTIERIVVKHA